MPLSSLPKVELHLHLDCSLSFDVVKKLNPSITKEEYRDNFIAPENCSNLKEYIECAQASIELMQTREQLEMVTLDLFDQLEKDNVIYAEIRFAPLQHTQMGLSASQVVSTVNAAVSKGIAQTGIQATLILCTLRHFDEDQSMKTVKLVEDFKDTHVSGFDIAADETLPIHNHIKAFEYARSRNIPCTAHAGEARGPESVREVMEHFHPGRIGHGVRAIENTSLMNTLIEKDIHLEVCPSSNVQTSIYDRLEDHRIDDIYNTGISLSINTDGRSLSDVSLTDEYSSLNRIFDWDLDHFYQCNLYAIEAAFTSETIKNVLRKKLQKGFDLYRKES